MTTQLLGIFIGAVLVVFCLWIMERGAGVTDEEVEAWLDWREEWAPAGGGRGIAGMGAEEMEMAGQGKG